MERRSFLLTEEVQRVEYTLGPELANAYKNLSLYFPKLLKQETPMSTLINKVQITLSSYTNNFNKVLREIVIIIEYLQALRTEVERCPEVYPLNVGDISRHIGTANNLKNRLQDLSRTNKKRKSTQREVRNGFEKLRTDFEGRLEELRTAVEECEKVTCEKLGDELYRV